MQSPIELSEDEVSVALQFAQLKELKRIRGMVTFFVVLALISIAASVISTINLLSLIR